MKDRIKIYFLKNVIKSQAQWCTHSTSEAWAEDEDPKAILHSLFMSFIETLRLAWAARAPISKRKVFKKYKTAKVS